MADKLTPDALEAAFDRIRSLDAEAKRQEELRSLVHQMGQAITDLVERLEASDPQTIADRLAGALKALTLPAPQVTVKMDPPQVTLEATIPPAPAPVIHLLAAEDVVFTVRKKNQYGADTVFTITRTAQASGKPPVAARAQAKLLAS